MCHKKKKKRKKKTKTGTDTCTPQVIATLFAIAKMWRQPKCPSTDKWINKMYNVHTMYSFKMEGSSDTCYSMNEDM
jgi:hypothetical protein